MIAAADVIGAFRRRTPAALYPLARIVYRRFVAPVECWGVDTADRVLRRTYDGRTLPPALLRFKVRGTTSGKSFAEIGRQCANDVAKALERAGSSLRDAHAILDFGCGCGGTLLWLKDLAPNAAISGTDIDADAIAWCRANVPDVTFTTNGATPPLAFDADSFDLVYAISVFTHLDEDYQRQWLGELRRVLRPGGFAVVTLHGLGSWREMPARDRETLDARGFVFVRNDSSGLFPAWYQTAFHSREYVERVFTAYFDVVGFLSRSAEGKQDVAVLRRRAD